MRNASRKASAFGGSMSCLLVTHDRPGRTVLSDGASTVHPITLKIVTKFSASLRADAALASGCAFVPGPPRTMISNACALSQVEIGKPKFSFQASNFSPFGFSRGWPPPSGCHEIAPALNNLGWRRDAASDKKGTSDIGWLSRPKTRAAFNPLNLVFS